MNYNVCLSESGTHSHVVDIMPKSIWTVYTTWGEVKRIYIYAGPHADTSEETLSASLC